MRIEKFKLNGTLGYFVNTLSLLYCEIIANKNSLIFFEHLSFIILKYMLESISVNFCRVIFVFKLEDL